MPALVNNAIVRRFTQPGVVLAAIVLTGAMGLVGGFQQIRSQIMEPSNIRGASANGAANPGLDTDADGVPDQVELANGTSAFLVDTDSDGIPDGQDANPTCASGTSCDALSVTAPVDRATTTPQGATTEAQVPSGSSQPSSAQLRQLLVQAGLDEQQVSALSDDELAAAWAAALQQASQSGQ